MADTRRNGQFFETRFFNNAGGLNNTDSPFKILETQAADGENFEYTQMGAIQKRRGGDEINAVADAELRCHGVDLYNTTLGVKTLVRAAERKIQLFDPSIPSFTNLSQDTTAAGTDVFPLSTEAVTAFSQFNTDTVSMLHFAGSTDAVYAVCSGKFTRNGVTPPSGVFAATTTANGGVWQTTGLYRYVVSYEKALTGAESNAYGYPSVVGGVTQEVFVTVSSTLDSVALDFSGLTSIDTVTYNKMNLYRSSVGGASEFTTGFLVASLTLPVTSYTDTGAYQLSDQNIPRANSLILDNSVLPSGTYNAVCAWKRRLVTAYGSTLRFSELNKPESWPTSNEIVIPSGGAITALFAVPFNTSFGNDEYLAIFKERELWMVRGNDITDVTLTLIDEVGCPAQSLIQLANGFLTWVDYRGIYLWDGSGKPIYCSQPIEAYFGVDGDLDKTGLRYGVSSYYRSRNMVYWYLSSKVYGEQGLCIKMDLRLSLPAVQSTLNSRMMQGVFVVERNSAVKAYGAKTYIPSSLSDERMVVGDASGKMYYAYTQYSDNDSEIELSYTTPVLPLGSESTRIRVHKVVVWVDAIGSWDLQLNYWSGYRTSQSSASSLVEPITTAISSGTALWDVGSWDVAYWDDYSQNLSGVVFNLNNDQGNSEGDSIRLQFVCGGVDQPITIYGWSIFWTEIGLTK